eukprot:TRINITY_DN6578_c0_g1_i1.p4 TRINITY_DN6578_c0_g1~~TRINITY_DN6578_c0_g1_i1.p4  ORF type:complete len:134 (+),score=29.81 TRINITY_DN6578_c0_g1_i1:1174-1575(+)
MFAGIAVLAALVIAGVGGLVWYCRRRQGDVQLSGIPPCSGSPDAGAWADRAPAPEGVQGRPVTYLNGHAGDPDLPSAPPAPADPEESPVQLGPPVIGERVPTDCSDTDRTPPTPSLSSPPPAHRPGVPETAEG